MAKQAMKSGQVGVGKPPEVTKTASGPQESEPRVYVDLATSEEDVVAYDQAGAFLVFNKKRFRTLSGDNLNALSHDNRKRYLQAKAALEADREALRPPPRAKIIDPLGRHEGALLDARVTDVAWGKKWHLCWKYCDEADSLAREGYTPVRAGEDPVECGLKPAGSSFILKDSRARADLDIILMKVSMTAYIQHQVAVSQLSTDKIKGYKDQFASEVSEQSEGRLKAAALDEEEPEKVSLRRSDLKVVE